jgi:DNA-binding transcriptional regulator YhcF (GntR family)
VITLDTSSAIPPFEQVRAQIAAQIAAGVLTAGTRLPPVRRMADDLGLAANTVARAYRDLEVAGLVETRGRGGTIVTAGGDQAVERLQAAAQRYAALAHDLGIDPERARRLVSIALDPAPEPGPEPGPAPALDPALDQAAPARTNPATPAPGTVLP